jgi:ferritin
MIKDKVKSALNKQFNSEMFSSYLYLGMSANSETLGLRGASHWFMAKYMEEQSHAMKVYRYLLDQGAEVTLDSIDKPEQGWSNLTHMLDRTLEHEKLVTDSVNSLMDVAIGERDHATQIFLHWFITEQIEEEATVGDLIARLKLVGGKDEGLYLIDNELEAIAAKINANAQIGTAALQEERLLTCFGGSMPG